MNISIPWTHKWPAGVPNAHHVSNRSSEPCSYLIVGTRVNQDVCHYPDTGRTLHTDGKAWRLLEADGQLFNPASFEDTRRLRFPQQLCTNV